MNRQSEAHPPPQATSPTSSSEYPKSSLSRYQSRFQPILWALVVVSLILMVIGIIFVAHQYFVGFGGQGFLKVRGEEQNPIDDYVDSLFLPLRQREVLSADSEQWRRSPGYNVPFYACGDQENSCAAFDEPNICCPPWSNCYKSSMVTVGVLCCNASWSRFQCQASEAYPPKCLASLVACSPATGGGCCPKDDICSPNGCIHISTASIQGVANHPTAAASSASGTNTVGSPITVTNTVIQVPAATYTVVKEGKIAQQKGTGSKGSVVSTLLVPYSSMWLLIFVGIVMGML